MPRNLCVFLLLFNLFTGCYVPKMLTTNIPTLPNHEFKTPPQKIVVASSYNIKDASLRDNKEKLFGELINLTLRHTSNEINSRSEIPASFVEGLVVQNDSSVNALMTEQLASHAIVVRSINAYFVQTGVVVAKTEGGKDREAYYDILVDIRYSFHNRTGLQFDTLISIRRFHSSRSVISGLLAAGPNIVKNSEDAADGIYANIDLYLKSCFKSSEPRTRMIYISKEFKEMNNVIQVFDYERAFAESEKLMNSDNNTLAAKAAYNCAVLLEYLGQYNKVKYYLQESLARRQSTQTKVMLNDYKLYKANP